MSMTTHVLGIPIACTDYNSSVDQASRWAVEKESHYIIPANVHVLMEAHDHRDYRQVLLQADLVTPDGMPVVWMMRLKGQHHQPRVYGPDLMLQVLQAAATHSIPVGFYGSAPDVLETLVKKMLGRFPSLMVAYSYSPPFRSLSEEEDRGVVNDIESSGARILFVGLGCPRQEWWMYRHRGVVNAVMIGVGAAFDFLAGAKSQAPRWMQHAGLEWFFRWMTEPRRLGKRYLFTNPRFVGLALVDWLGLGRF